MQLLKRVNELLDDGKTFCFVTVIVSGKQAGVPCGYKALVLSDGLMEEEGDFFHTSTELPKMALKALSVRKKGIVELAEGTKVFIDILSGKPELLVCGAGHIAVPLASFARQVGFKVTVLDDRPEFANSSRFPDCQVIAEDFTKALRDMALEPATYAVVITRGHEHDTVCLLELLKKESAYVGLIGSRRRIVFVKEILAREGISRDRLDEIFTPIGLPVGAESPAEIALCITAELVCVRNAGVEQARKLRSAGGGG